MLERDGDVGGTWHQNTYPGCQCDVPSNLYSFSFAPNAEWSQTFALQPEIGAYLKRVADDFGVRPYVRTRTDGDRRRLGRAGAALADRDQRAARSPRACSSPAWAALSEPAIPSIPGADSFAGPRLPHRPLGPRRRPDRQARRRDRHRRLRGPGRAADPAAGRAAERLPAHAAVDHAAPRPPDPPARARAVPRAAARCRSSCAARSTGAASASCCRSSFHRLSRVPERDGAQAPGAQVADPALREQAHAALRDRLQADPDERRVLPGAAAAERAAGDGRDRAHHADRRRDGRRRRAPGRRDRLGHRLPRHRHAVRRVAARPRRAHARRRLARAGDAGPARHDRRRLPEPVHARRPEHRASGTTRSSS